MGTKKPRLAKASMSPGRGSRSSMRTKGSGSHGNEAGVILSCSMAVGALANSSSCTYSCTTSWNSCSACSLKLRILRVLWKKARSMGRSSLTSTSKAAILGLSTAPMLKPPPFLRVCPLRACSLWRTSLLLSLPSRAATCARLHKSGSIAGGSAAPGRALRSAAARLSSFQASSVLRMVNVTVPASTTALPTITTLGTPYTAKSVSPVSRAKTLLLCLWYSASRSLSALWMDCSTCSPKSLYTWYMTMPEVGPKILPLRCAATLRCVCVSSWPGAHALSSTSSGCSPTCSRPE
mmetsp:Transcript_6566/g.17600  ORF Transcript_6566/g.17600 Transcript_6566/m.17600 type:complete len:293 (-) Transcript_6566:359-1237(-)